jgi:hypothetical protein
VFFDLPGAESLVLAIGNAAPRAADLAEMRALAAQSGDACRGDINSGLP